jgi:hypothetical protein
MSIGSLTNRFIANGKTTGITAYQNNIAKTGALKILIPSIPVKVT